MKKGEIVMKHWKVDYSTKTSLGIREDDLIVEAATIDEALLTAREAIIAKEAPATIVIWDVGIIEDDVF